MTATQFALLGYVSWTLLLVVFVGSARTAMVMSGGRTANSFAASGEDVDGFAKRLTRAHANCYENLPVAGALLLYAIATAQTSITDGLAFALLGARIAQSLTHLISTSETFVLIRFMFYIVQIAILGFWIVAFLGAI